MSFMGHLRMAVCYAEKLAASTSPSAAPEMSSKPIHPGTFPSASPAQRNGIPPGTKNRQDDTNIPGSVRSRRLFGRSSRASSRQADASVY